MTAVLLRNGLNIVALAASSMILVSQLTPTCTIGLTTSDMGLQEMVQQPSTTSEEVSQPSRALEKLTLELLFGAAMV